MRSIRFGKTSSTSGTVTKKAVPPSAREPWLKRAFQLVFVLALVTFGGYWFFSAVAFRQYEGIVVGDQSTLSSLDSGVVREIYVDAHYPFLANTDLMKLDSSDLALKVETVEKEIALIEKHKGIVTEQELEDLRVRRTSARALVQVAEATKKVSEERESSAKDLLSRIEKLKSLNAATQSSVDSRSRELRQSQADLAAANQRVVEAKLAADAADGAYERYLQVGSRVQDDEKDLLTKKALLRELKEHAERLVVTGVRPGIVTHLSKLPGDNVRPGDPLIQVLYEGDIHVDAYVDPRDRQLMTPGTAVTIKAVGGPFKKPIRGVVSSISPVTHTIPETHRDIHESPDQFIVARVNIDARELLDAGLSPGQIVRVQAPRW